MACLAAPCPADPQPPTTDAQQVLRVAIDAEPVHLNPVLDPDLWGYRIAHDLICEPLVRPKENGDGYEGVLAERFSVDADGTGVDLALHKGVRFHDGRLLTAHDVRATLELVQEATRSAPRTQSLLQDLYRIEVYSQERLRVSLRRPNGRLLAALSEIDILPAHLLEPKDNLISLRRRPVCTGPYRLQEWHHGPDGRLVLRRDPAYWGTAPRLHELHFLVVPDPTRALSLLRRGGAEVLGRLPMLYVPDQVEPAMLKDRLRKLEIPSHQMMLVLWNARHPLLASPLVRRALSRLIDRQRLVTEVRHGLAEPLPLPPPLPGKITDGEGPQALLDQAGLGRQPPGGRSLGGKPLRLGLLVPAGSTEAGQVARRLTETLAKEDITLVPESVDFATLQARLRRGAFDAALLAWSWTGNEADLAPLLHRGGGQTYGGAETAELDVAIDALHRAIGQERRRSAQAALGAVLLAQEPVTFLYRPLQLLLIDRRVQPAVLPLSGDFLRLRAAELHLSQ